MNKFYKLRMLNLHFLVISVVVWTMKIEIDQVKTLRLL